MMSCNKGLEYCILELNCIGQVDVNEYRCFSRRRRHYLRLFEAHSGRCEFVQGSLR